MFFTIIMKDIRTKNIEFFNLLLQALQFDRNYFTIIPSVFFLVFSMSVIYRITHKNVSRFRRSSYRDALYREIAFQWLYLYITRAWLYVVKGLRVISNYLEDIVLKTGGTQSNVYCIHVLMFLIFTLLSIAPLLLTITVFTTEETLDQNILFWIPPNRWTRSELGPAGRLMERPPDFIFQNTKFPHAYEMKRSVSSQNAKTSSNVQIIRYCKSGCLPDQASSLDDIIRGD